MSALTFTKTVAADGRVAIHAQLPWPASIDIQVDVPWDTGLVTIDGNIVTFAVDNGTARYKKVGYSAYDENVWLCKLVDSFTATPGVAVQP